VLDTSHDHVTLVDDQSPSNGEHARNRNCSHDLQFWLVVIERPHVAQAEICRQHGPYDAADQNQQDLSPVFGHLVHGFGDWVL